MILAAVAAQMVYSAFKGELGPGRNPAAQMGEPRWRAAEGGHFTGD